MAADSRYLYHSTQGLAAPQYSYQYQNPPPPTSYEQSPVQHSQSFPPPPSRNIRTTQPPPHSSQVQYHAQPPPPSSQSTAYAPAHAPYASQGHYMTHGQAAPPQSAPAQHTPPPPPHPQQQQWSNEGWSPQYSHYPSHVPQQHHQQQQQLSPPLPATVAPENTYNSAPARPETSPALSTSSLRGYDDRAASMHHQPPPQSSINGVPTTKYRQREVESPSSYTNSQPASPNVFNGLDYDQLMKQIKSVESPLRETLSTFRSPHPETLEQMMQAATYAAQVLNSAAGITATITTSPPPGVTYHQTNTIPTPQGYSHNSLSPPTSRDRMDNDTQSPHNHTISNENSPPLSASATGSLQRRHTNEYPENSQQSPSLSGSSSGLPPGSGSQVLHQHSPSMSSSLAQQPLGQQLQSFSQSQPPSQPQPGAMATSNPPPAQSEGQTCLGCNATSTPEWRRGPMGPRTLCNACGLVYAKLIKKRDRERARANGTSKSDRSSRPASGEGHRSGSGGGDTGSGESDEDEPEDDFGSGTFGRRTEFG